MSNKGLLYLSHFTNVKYLDTIIKSGYIYTPYERWVHKINACGFNYKEFDDFKNKNFKVDLQEFPGVYCRYFLEKDKNKIAYILFEKMY